jgi:hypothetical protein
LLNELLIWPPFETVTLSATAISIPCPVPAPIVFDSTLELTEVCLLARRSADENRVLKMKARIDRMTPGDMPAFDGSLALALNDFNTLPSEVAVKHMILISDGDPGGPTASILQGYAKAKIKITTVGIGTNRQVQLAFRLSF